MVGIYTKTVAANTKVPTLHVTHGNRTKHGLILPMHTTKSQISSFDICFTFSVPKACWTWPRRTFHPVLQPFVRASYHCLYVQAILVICNLQNHYAIRTFDGDVEAETSIQCVALGVASSQHIISFLFSIEYLRERLLLTRLLFLKYPLLSISLRWQPKLRTHVVRTTRVEWCHKIQF